MSLPSHCADYAQVTRICQDCPRNPQGWVLADLSKVLANVVDILCGRIPLRLSICVVQSSWCHMHSSLNSTIQLPKPVLRLLDQSFSPSPDLFIPIMLDTIIL